MSTLIGHPLVFENGPCATAAAPAGTPRRLDNAPPVFSPTLFKLSLNQTTTNVTLSTIPFATDPNSDNLSYTMYSPYPTVCFRRFSMFFIVVQARVWHSQYFNFVTGNPMVLYLTPEAVLSYDHGPRLFSIIITATDDGVPPMSANFTVERKYPFGTHLLACC